MSAAAPAPARTEDQPLTIGATYRFFVPLLAMAELVMISHTVVNAALARLPDPERVLAGYNAAFSLHILMGAPVWAGIMAALSLISGRASYRQMMRFQMLLALGIAIAEMVLVFTEAGTWLFADVVGLSREAAWQARIALFFQSLTLAAAVIRTLAFAVLMKARRTAIISAGTGVRVGVLFVLVFALPHVTTGAAVGGGAIFGCIAAEALFVAWVSRKEYLTMEPGIPGEPSLMAIARFSWPLMLVQAAEQGFSFIINFFLGRLAHPDTAVAAFGVLDGLFRLLFSSLRNLNHTAQSLRLTAGDQRVLGTFTLQVVVICSAVVAMLFFGPVRQVVLAKWMGLSPVLVDLIGPALLLGVPAAFAVGYSALYRGLLLAHRESGAIATSAVARVAVVAAIGALALPFPQMNGAMLGALGFIGAFGSEAVVLGLRLWRIGRRERGTPQEAASTSAD